jgi:hypothetical protein
MLGAKACLNSHFFLGLPGIGASCFFPLGSRFDYEKDNPSCAIGAQYRRVDGLWRGQWQHG